MKQLNENIPHILKAHKRIAVVGLSDRAFRPSYGVARLMNMEGYTVIPVNPNVESVFGIPAYDHLLDIPGEIDLVNIFRRPEYVPDIVDAAIEKNVRSIWMQLGVIHPEAAEKALKAGIDVVMDRCWAVEYPKYMYE